ncbi:hypothetical protein [Mesorhizobium sp. M0767]|uniref:hypothetical protein n=1 Tax=Mesorhizobium sp. M0767 TaxID=2956995 RepID=UPI00333D6C06
MPISASAGWGTKREIVSEQPIRALGRMPDIVDDLTMRATVGPRQAPDGAQPPDYMAPISADQPSCQLEE